MRLTQRDDSGVAGIFVVLFSVILLGAVGFAVDVGRAVASHRSAQNSADAVALAMGLDCVRTGSLSATGYDRFIRTGPAIGNGQSQKLDAGGCKDLFVRARAYETVDYTFARVLGLTDTLVARVATAQWEKVGVKSATTLPIAIASCEFTEALPPDATETVEDITLFLDDPKPQSGCSSLPGGFSQLLGDGCDVKLSTDGTVDGMPGGDVHKVVPCITNATTPALPHDVLIPIYDSDACQADPDCKGHGPYKILGFAMFRVTGYSFEGNKNDGTLDKDCPYIEKKDDRGKYCIRGDFIRFASSPGTAPDPGSDFGAFQVYLSS